MIIFNLDGTLANCEHRRHFIVPTCNQCKSILDDSIEFDLGWHCDYPCDNVTHKDEWKPDWQSFYEACDNDEPIKETLEILINCILSGRKVEIWSGRCSSVREKTMQWLKQNLYSSYRLRSHLLDDPELKIKMRPIGDNTPDDQLKEKWLDEAIAEGKTIERVFDDRPKVVRMWRKRSIFVFNVNQTGEEF